MLKPDIVVASLFDKRSTRELLKAQGASARRILGAARRSTRSRPRSARWARSSAIRIAPRRRSPGSTRRSRGRGVRLRGKHYRVLPLSRRGWVSGSDSLVSSLLAETGLFNAAGELGIGFGGFASLEAIVEAASRISCCVSEAGDRAEDDGRAFLLHPALERFYPPRKAHRDSGAADRMRRRDAGRRAGCAGRGIEAGQPITSGSSSSSLRKRGIR